MARSKRYNTGKTKARCNVRYGYNLYCKRLPHHPGNHAIRLSPFELNMMLTSLTYNQKHDFG